MIFAFLLFILLSVQNIAVADEPALVLIDGPEVDLTLSDVKKALLSVPRDIRYKMLASPAKLHEVVSSTYVTKVAAARARKNHLDEDPEVSAKIWNRTLNILAGAEVNAYVDKMLADEGDFTIAAREEYLAHKNDYITEKTVDVSHILIKGDDKGALEKAKKITIEIESGKIDFENAAEKYSEDLPSKKTGGRLGKIVKGRMVKPFEDVAFTIEPGKISSPVKTRFGYHIIMVHSRTPASLIPFEQVKEKITGKLKKQMEAKIRRDYWMKIEDDASIHVNSAAIEAFVKKPVLQ